MPGQDAIKQKIQLDGEKEYSAAIKAAQRNLRTLRSELKAETAELGKNATEQQKNEAKTKSLQKQIAEQEKIVKAYQDALAEVKEKYGDNEDAIAKWEIKLNDARTALANMKNGLEDTGKGFDSIQNGASDSIVETKALADTFKDIADNAGTMATGIEGIFKDVTSSISEMVGAVWGDLMEVASRADQYFDLGAFLGASATDVQKWDYAMKSVSGDISTITNMVSRLKYGGKADKVTEWFGISGENYTNDLEYAEAVLQQMYNMKDEMKASGTWDEAMQEIFGARKTQEVDSILSDWEQIQHSLEIFGREGMSEDQLQTMADLRYQVDLLTERWDLFKSKVETQLFGKLALDLTGNAQGILDAFLELIGIDPNDPQAAQKRDAAIKKLEENLTQAFEAIGKAIEEAAKALGDVGETLSGSDNQYIKLVGNLLTGISDAMEWMTKPGSIDTIKSFLTKFFELWTVGKATEAIGNIVALGTNISTLLNLGSLGAGAGASFAQAGAAVGTSWGGAFAAAVLAAAPWLLAILANDIIPEENQVDNEKRVQSAETNAEEIQRLIEWAKLQNEINELTDKYGTDEFDEEKYNQLWAEIEKLGEVQKGDLWSKYWDYIVSNDLTGQYPIDILQKMLDELTGGEQTETPAEPTVAPNSSRTMRKRNITGTAEQLVSAPEVTVPEPTFPSLPLWAFGGLGGATGAALTHDDINTFNSLPAQMKNAVATAVSGIKVSMDGRTVGQLVAPFVSEELAADMYD